MPTVPQTPAAPPSPASPLGGTVSLPNPLPAATASSQPPPAASQPPTAPSQPPTATAPSPSLYEAITDYIDATNAGMNRRADPRDAILNLPEDAPDPAKRHIAAQAFEAITGIRSPDGAILTPDRTPLDGAAYAAKVRDILKRGTASLRSPEYQAWLDIPEDDEERRYQTALAALSPIRRAAAKFGASVEAGRAEHADPGLLALVTSPGPGYAYAPAPSDPAAPTADSPLPTATAPDAPETRASVIAEYEAKLAADHFLERYAAAAPALSEPARDIIRRAAQSGSRGILTQDAETFRTLPKKEQRVVSSLISSALPPRSRNFLRDMGLGLLDLTERMTVNLARQTEDLGFQPPPPMFGTAASYARHAEITAERAAMSQEQRDAERLTANLWRQATTPRAFDSYSIVEEAFIGAATTVPYMLIAGIPYIGAPLVAIDQFQNVRDRVLLEGGDPNQAQAAQWAAAIAYAYIEKLSYHTAFGKPLSTLGMRSLFLNVSRHGYAYAARQIGTEITGVTVAETIEEMLQRATDEATAAGLLDKDIAAAASRGFIEEAQTWNTMLLIGALGTAKKAAKAKWARASNLDLAETVTARLRALTAIQESSSLPQPKSPDTQKRLALARKIWTEAPSDLQALARLQSELDLDRDRAIAIADYFGLENALLHSTRTPEGRKQYRQAISLDPAFLQTLLPGATITPLTPDPAAPAAPTAPSQLPTATAPASARAAVRPTRHRVFEGGSPLAISDPAAFRANDPGKAYRLTGKPQVSDMLQAGGVRARAGKMKGGRQGEVHWSAGHKSLAYAPRDGAYLIETAVADLNDREGVLPNSAVRLWKADGGRWIDATAELAGTGAVNPEPKKTITHKRTLPNGRRVTQELPNPAHAAWLAARQKASTPAAPAAPGRDGSPQPSAAAPAPAPAPQRYRLDFPVTLPDGTRSTASYTIEAGALDPDLSTPAAAAEVQKITGGSVRADDYLAMTPEQQAEILSAHGLAVRSQWKLTAPDGSSATTSGLLSLVTAPGPGTARATNLDLIHEHLHAVAGILKAAGVLTPERVATMRQLFGDPTHAGEDFDEESAAEALAANLLGRDPHPEAEPIFSAIRAGARRLLETLKVIPPEAELSARAQALDIAFEALRTGDLSLLDPFSGITFTDETDAAPAPSDPAASRGTATSVSSAPDAQSTNIPPAEGDDPAASASAVEAARAAVPPAASRGTATSVSSAPADQSTRTGLRAEIAALNDKVDRLMQLLASGAPIPASRPTGQSVSIVTPTGNIRFTAEWHAVELDDLVTSDNPGYPQEFQPRDRSTVTSRVQVLKFSAPGAFDPERLFDSAESDGGSPITAGGLIVISGNGRVMILREVANAGRWQEYDTAARAFAARAGITIPDGMRRPVLVRRVTSVADRETLVKIAELSNRPKILQRNESELAEADAKLLTPDLVSIYAPGSDANLLAASNAPFMQAFARAAQAEGDLDSNGKPTQALAMRVRNAFLAALLGEGADTRDLIRTLIEQSGELGMRTLLNSIIDHAGPAIALHHAKPELSILAALRAAVRSYVSWKTSGTRATLAEHLAQGDLLAAPPSPALAIMLTAAEQGRLGPLLDRYAELARAIDTQTADMFGATPDPLPLLQKADADTRPTGEPASAPASAASQAQPAPTPTASSQLPTATAPAASRGTATSVSSAPAPSRPPTAPSPAAPFTPAPLQPTTLDTPEGTPTWTLLGTAGKAVPTANAPDSDRSDQIPLFQGGKRSLAARAEAAIKRLMTPSERARYTVIWDGFGGSGGWGLYHANTSLPNVREISIGEFNPSRMAKIKFFHTQGRRLAEVEASPEFQAFKARVIANMTKRNKDGETVAATSAGKLAAAISDTIKENGPQLSDDVIAVAQAIFDRAANGPQDAADTREMIYAKILNGAIKDAAAIQSAAQEFRDRGGTFTYRTQRDTYKADLIPGSNVFTIIDPPYYLTSGYDEENATTSDKVGLDTYQQTLELIRRAAAAGNAILYTDSAWWLTKEFTPQPAEILFGETHSTEQKILLDIFNTLDHLDTVHGLIGQRKEIIGVHHAHTTDESTATGQRSLRSTDGPVRREQTDGPIPAPAGNGPVRDQDIPGVAKGDAGQAAALRSANDPVAPDPSTPSIPSPDPRLSLHPRAQDLPALTGDPDPATIAAFGSWIAPAASAEDRLLGFRGFTPGRPVRSGRPQGFGATEGHGIYLMRDKEDAEFFGTPIPLEFDQPRHAIIVDQDNADDPLPLLQEDESVWQTIETQPESPADTDWIRAHKRAHADTPEWNPDSFADALTSHLLDLGYDSIHVTSGGQQWAVILRDLNVTLPDGTRYSLQPRETDPLGLYSRLREHLQAKMPARATAETLRNLTDPAKGHGIKADELRWTGFQDFLDALPPGSTVTKEAALAAITDPPLTETVLGDPANLIPGAFGGSVQRSPDTATLYEQYTTPGYVPGTYRERLISLTPAPAANNGFSIVPDPFNPGRLAIRNPQGAIIETRLSDPEARERLASYVNVTRTDTYQSSHWPYNHNVLLHIRHADRLLPDGATALDAEEFQSDWHQDGREKGYRPRNQAEYNKSDQASDARVPPAPYADTSKGWATLAARRILRIAAERGLRTVTWTTGRTQIERFEDSFRQAVDTIEWFKEGYAQSNVLIARKAGGIVQKIEYKSDGTVSSPDYLAGQHLSAVIGKDAATKVLAAPAGRLSGDDLHIGGEGMIEFYDRIMPRVFATLGKPYAAAPSTVTFAEDAKSLAAVNDRAREIADHIAEYGEYESLDLSEDNVASRVFGALIDDPELSFSAAIDNERAADPDNSEKAERDALVRFVGKAAAITRHRFDIPPAMAADILAGQPRFSLQPRETAPADPANAAEEIAKRDAEYMAAVEAGDVEAAQRMVDEAAKAAGYIIYPLYHGTEKPGFFIFNAQDNGGIFLSSSKSVAKTYIDGNMAIEGIEIDDKFKSHPKHIQRYKRSIIPAIYHLALNPGKMAVVDAKGKTWSDIDELKHLLNAKLFYYKVSYEAGENGNYLILQVTELNEGDENTNLIMDLYMKEFGAKQEDIDYFIDDMFLPDEKRMAEFISYGLRFPSLDVYNEFARKHVSPYAVMDDDLIGFRPPLNLLNRVTTRKVAEHYKSLGYDSVRFDNIVDLGKGEGTHFDTANEVKPSTVYWVGDPARIKMINAATFDDRGRVIPLSERFNPRSPDIRFSLQPRETAPADPANAAEEIAKRDAEYMAAVEAGDMEAAQRMVDEAAKAAGYTIKAYHGTRTDFNVPRTRGISAFDERLANVRGDNDAGMFFSNVRDTAKDFAQRGRRGDHRLTASEINNDVWPEGARIIDAYLRLDNPKEFDGVGDFISYRNENFNRIQDALREEGHDGIVLRNASYDASNPDETWYIATDPSQIKSADAATYDDNGDLIPLSRRFDDARADIRFSIRRTSRRNPASNVEALITARILAGKPAAPADVAAILKNAGIRTAETPEQILDRANARAQALPAAEAGRIRAADPALFERLANDAERDRLAARIGESFGAGAQAASPAIGAAADLALARERTARAAIESAAGFTAAEMQAELGIDLAATVLNTPDIQPTAAELDARANEREAARREAELNADLDAEADPAPLPPSPEMTALLNQILAAAEARAAAEALERQRRDMEKQRKAARRAESTDDPALDDDPDAEPAPATEPDPVYRLVAPLISNPEEFAQFIREWVRRRLAKTRPEDDPAAPFRHPAALRDLQRTAQHILADLARQLLGTGGPRIAAEHAIARLADAPTERSTIRDIADIYSRIHRGALRKSRTDMISRLQREIARLAKDTGRWQENKEDLRRKVTAATERWARTLSEYIALSPDRLLGETRRLQKIIADADTDPADPAAPSDPSDTDDRKLRDALDKLAILQTYGGMINWMPGQIAEAADSITAHLNGERQAHEARRLEAEAAAARIRGTLIKAVSNPDESALTPEPGGFSRFADSLIGNLQLRLNYLIRFAKGTDRAAALAAIDDIMTELGRAAEQYRVIQSDAHEALGTALEQIYGDRRAAARRLDTPIPAAAQAALSRQGVRLTYGRAIQLYASILQRHYAENVRIHKRAKDLDTLRTVLDSRDLALHQWLVAWYDAQRGRLSEAQQLVTGCPVLSEDRLYMPAVILREPSGFRGRHAAWTPIAASLTPRVRHRLDFDERASVLNVFADRLEDNALIRAYGPRGIFLRDAVAHQSLQSAITRFHGSAQRSALMNQLEDTLRGGRQVTRSDAWLAPANTARRWISRFYLSGNILSAAKQIASVPVWANIVGFRNLARYIFDIDSAAIRELMQSPGFRARYASGWSEETANILSDHRRNPVAKLYDAGLLPNRTVDAVAGLWIAQGVYRDLKATLTDRGYSADEARSRAQTLTWNLIEQTQQSARTEMLLLIQREQPLTRVLFQFANSPIQQMQFELEAFREFKAGTPGSRSRLARALIINHVLVPAILLSIEGFFNALLGRQPEDDRWRHWLVASILGQFSALFIIGSLGERGLITLLGGKYPYWKTDELPLAGIKRPFQSAFDLIRHTALYGADALTPGDFSEVTADDILTDLHNLGRATVAPYRHISEAVRNRRD